MYTPQLHAWRREVEQSLPAVCPNCDARLAEILYTVDKETIHIRVTGATNTTYWMFARCPSCEHTLKGKILDKRHR